MWWGVRSATDTYGLQDFELLFTTSVRRSSIKIFS